MYFAASENAEVPTIPSSGVASDPAGLWFDVDVPLNAKTGRTRVTVDLNNETVTLDGPVLTITEEKLRPVVDAVSPLVVTRSEPPVTLQIKGGAFYPEISKLVINDEEHPIDWSQSTWSLIRFPLPSSIRDEIGTYEVLVRTANGGDSASHTLKVVEPISLVSAESISVRIIELTFDRAFDRDIAENNQLYEIDGHPDPVEEVTIFDPEFRKLMLTLRFPMPTNEQWTLRVNEDFRSAEGGKPGEREVIFDTWEGF